MPDHSYFEFDSLDTPESNQREPGTDLILLWFAATVAGLGLPAALQLLFGTSPSGGSPSFLAVTAASLGLFQWLVLQRYAPVSRSWVVSTFVGGTLGFGVGALTVAVVGFVGAMVLDDEPEFVLTMLLFISASGVAAGSILGCAQWLVLRRHAFRAGWWILATAVGYAFFPFVAFSGVAAATRGEFTRSAAAAIFALGFPALLTGISMQRILRRPKVIKTAKGIGAG